MSVARNIAKWLWVSRPRAGRARRAGRLGGRMFPAAYLNEQAIEIRLLLDHRQDLVAERTRTVNRLRWHLLVLCPELERSLRVGH